VGVEATAVLLGQIVDALRTGAEPPSSGREARDAIVVVEAAYESAATGRRIELEPRYAASARAC
jgi:predicted dehydrogenase